MDFNLIRKDKFGVISLLLFVVLISQSSILNLVFDTALGRALLIGFIIIISYFNKIMGVVSVLVLIVMFNNSGLGMEGLETMVKKDASQKDASPNLAPNPAPTIVLSKKDGKTKKDEPNEPIKQTEGFCVADRERKMQQGVNSNSVPTHKKNDDTFLPFEDWTFQNTFSALQY